MDRKIKALMFGSEEDCQDAFRELKASDLPPEYTYEYMYADELEEFGQKLVDWEPTLLIIVADGARGMECVYRSRERRPCIPVFWFSDDKNFCILSYRLDCAYFATKPVTAEKINSAFRRCGCMGIQYGTC